MKKFFLLLFLSACEDYHELHITSCRIKCYSKENDAPIYISKSCDGLVHIEVKNNHEAKSMVSIIHPMFGGYSPYQYIHDHRYEFTGGCVLEMRGEGYYR